MRCFYVKVAYLSYGEYSDDECIFSRKLILKYINEEMHSILLQLKAIVQFRFPRFRNITVDIYTY